MTYYIYELGDHLEARRACGVYWHHGIYVGGGQVIHWVKKDRSKTEGVVKQTSFQVFADGQPVRRSSDHPARTYDPLESIRRAESWLGRDDYKLISNNCEHFVNWCIDGEKKSDQVRDYAKGLVVAGLLGGLVVAGKAISDARSL